jgi:hypothetical protein
MLVELPGEREPHTARAKDIADPDDEECGGEDGWRRARVGARRGQAIDPQAVKLRLAPEALAMLTDGIDLRGAKLRPWYEREN